MSKYSAGCIYYYPSFHCTHNPSQAEKLQKELKRYLTRKIGFEAVMRIRCTKGMKLEKLCFIVKVISIYVLTPSDYLKWLFIRKDFTLDPASCTVLSIYSY